MTTDVIEDCRLQTADSRIDDCRLTLPTADWDCRLGLPIVIADCRLPIAIAKWDCDCDCRFRLPIADCRLVHLSASAERAAQWPAIAALSIVPGRPVSIQSPARKRPAIGVSVAGLGGSP